MHCSVKIEWLKITVSLSSKYQTHVFRRQDVAKYVVQSWDCMKCNAIHSKTSLIIMSIKNHYPTCHTFLLTFSLSHFKSHTKSFIKTIKEKNILMSKSSSSPMLSALTNLQASLIFSLDKKAQGLTKPSWTLNLEPFLGAVIPPVARHNQ